MEIRNTNRAQKITQLISSARRFALNRNPLLLANKNFKIFRNDSAVPEC